MMNGLQKKDRIFIAGHRGLVGSALLEELQNRDYRNLITRNRYELDLLNQNAVESFYSEARPDVVLIAAAKVGGIYANNTYRADFIAENLTIQNNLIVGAHKANVRRLVFLGSSCIYPRSCAQPMKEEYLLTGPLEFTNQPYAIAKIAGLELVNTYRQQYQRDWFSVMPTNLYGPRDNFHPENSHVLPALIRRFEEARKTGANCVVIWGTGTPKREFMLASDCAKSVIDLAENNNVSKMIDTHFEGRWSHINIGTGQEVTIAELAEKIRTVTSYQGDIVFDNTKPDGTPRKLLDISLLRELKASNATDLMEGLRLTTEFFRHYVS